MAISKQHDLSEEVYCPVCQWRGQLGESRYTSNKLASCPKCAACVYQSQDFNEFNAHKIRKDDEVIRVRLNHNEKDWWVELTGAKLKGLLIDDFYMFPNSCTIWEEAENEVSIVEETNEQ